MGRAEYSQSSQLSTLVGKPVSRYTKLPKNTDTLRKLTDVKAKPNNRFHYSIYPSVETEYQASYSQLTNLDFYSPVITILGDNPYSHLINTPFTDPGFTLDETSTLVSNVSTVNTNAFGTFDVTYVATDGINPDTTKVRIVKVGEYPVVTFEGDNPYTLERYDPYDDEGVDVDANSSVTSTTSSVNNTAVGTYTVNYTVSNPVFTSFHTRIVNVVDTTPPVVTILGDNPYTLERFDVYTDPGATGDLGTIVTPDLSNVQNTSIGSFVVVYNATDGNTLHDVGVTRTVNVVDTVPPVITVLGDNPFTLERFDVYTDPGATVDRGTILTTDLTAVNNTLPHGSSFVVTYTGSDGNTIHNVEATRTVVIEDTKPPVITLLGDNPYEMQPGIDFRDVDPLYEVDLGTSVSIDYSNVVTTDNSVYYVVYRASDGANPDAVVLRRVSVADTLSPIVTIIGDNPYTLERYAEYVDPGATTDTESGSYFVSTTSTVDNTAVGSYTVTYDVTDDINANTIVQRIVNVVDTTAPIVTLNGASSVTLERYGVFSDIDEGVEIEAPGSLVSVDTSQLDNTTQGTYTVTYNVVDEYENANVITREVVVQDTVPPVVTLNNESTSYTLERYGDWSAIDPGVTVDRGSYVESVTVDNTTIGNQVVTYTVKDGTNTTNNRQRIIEVVDTVAPTGSIANPSYQLERLDIFNDPGVENLDSGTYLAGTDTSNVDNTLPHNSTFDVIYDLGDGTSNTILIRTVTVLDRTPPVISLVNGDVGTTDYTVERGTTYVDPGATTDTGESVTINTSGLNMDVTGTYTVTYSATDSAGNTGTASRTVIVEDTTDPVITLTGANPYTVERGTTYIDPGVTADTGETVTINTSGLNMAVTGTYTVTYSATDTSGNIGTANRTVIVEDTIAPVIILSGANPYTVEKGTTYSDPGVTADTGEPVTINTSGLNMSVSGTYTVTYSATDSYGNNGTNTRTVIVEDTISPVITLSGANPYTVERGTTYIDPGATTDTGESVIINTSGLNMSVSGTYTVTYSATDADGNTGTASRTVIVDDVPVITLVGSDPFYQQNGSVYGDPGATADGGETIITDISGVNTGVNGSYTVYYSTDSTLVGTATRTVNVDNYPTTLGTTPTFYNIYSSAVSSDGSVFVLGADGGTSKAYYSNGTQKGGTLTALKSYYSGWTCDISANGNRIIIGEPNFFGNGGNARVYDWNGSSWSTTDFGAPSGYGNWNVGSSVAISDDGNTVFISDYQGQGVAYNSGYFYVARYNGSSWSIPFKVSGGSYDYFGNGDMSGDASTIVAVLASGNGHIYTYRGTPGSYSYISTHSFATSQIVGSISLSSDGNTLAYVEGLNLKLFSWTSSGWSQIGLSISVTTVTAKIKLSGDGRRIAIGDPSYGNNKGISQLYEWNGLAWSQVGGNMIGGTQQRVGTSVSINYDGARVCTVWSAGAILKQNRSRI